MNDDGPSLGESASGDAVIAATQLTKLYGGEEVLRNVDISIERGEIIALIGPSGAGKSTLLRCLSLLEPVSGGTLSVQGEEIPSYTESMPWHKRDRLLKKQRHSIGVVFQNFNLFPHKNALDNVMLPLIRVARVNRDEAESRARECIRQVGMLSHVDHFPSELSGGQQQRIAIARALAVEPQILFFDEPTSALDAENSREVLKVIRDLAGKGISMVLVTHEIQFARTVSDRIYMMANGEVVETQPTRDFFDRPTEARTREFLAATDAM